MSAFMLGVIACALFVIVPMFSFMSNEALAVVRGRVWSQEAAGWAQAGGAVIAIGVAIWAPWTQQRRQAQEKAEEREVGAIRLAVIIVPELAYVADRVRLLSERLHLRLQHPQPLLPADCQSCKIEPIPTELVKARSQIQLLPMSVAVRFLQFLALLDQMNRGAESTAIFMAQMAPGDARARTAAIEFANLVQGVAINGAQVLDSIGEFHDRAVLEALGK